MEIFVNTDNHIKNPESFSTELKETLKDKLAAFATHITRIEIYLADENSTKGGSEDKKCTIEARLEGELPTAVTHHGATLRDAFSGATQKIKRTIQKTVERKKKA